MTNQWTITAVSDMAAEPQRIVMLFPAAGRAVGRAPVDPVGDPLGCGTAPSTTGRARSSCAPLLAALPAEAAATSLADLYRYGDDAERRGVLCGLNASSNVSPEVTAAGVELVADALRTNDPRLVAAGPRAVRRARTSTSTAGGTACSRRCSWASRSTSSPASTNAPTPSSPAWRPRSSPNGAPPGAR